MDTLVERSGFRAAAPGGSITPAAPAQERGVRTRAAAMAEAAARAAAEAADEERRQAWIRGGWWSLAYHVLEYDEGGSPHVRRYALTDEQDYKPTEPGLGWSFAVKGPGGLASTYPPYGRWRQYADLKDKTTDFDTAYERIRSTSTPYIGNARLMAFDFTKQAAWELFSIRGSSDFASFRMELTLSDRGAEGSRNLHKCVSFAWQTEDMGTDANRILVIRAVESVRMLGQPLLEDGTVSSAYVRLPLDLWRPDVEPALPNVPYFVAMEVVPNDRGYTSKRMYLLDPTGRDNWALQRWYRMIRSPDPSVRVDFPTTCSDPYIRTDRFTLEQERAKLTNRMSVADLVRLARPFHGRQNEYLKRYLPGGGYVQKAKRQMLEGGMMEKREDASLLPSLAGLRM